jgi:Zn-dependent protease
MRMQWVDFVQFLVQYTFLIFSAAVHESAHAWSAFKLGDPTAKLQNRVSLNPANHIDIIGTVIIPLMGFFSGFPIIGWARPTPVDPRNFSNPKRDSMFVSAAGPISNMLTVCVLTMLWYLARYFVHPERPLDSQTVVLLILYVVGMGIFMNLLLAVFNLVPVYPLDGSGVVEGLLPHSLSIAYAKMRRYGFLILIILFYVAGLGRWVSLVVGYLARWLGVQWIPLKAIW